MEENRNLATDNYVMTREELAMCAANKLRTLAAVVSANNLDVGDNVIKTYHTDEIEEEINDILKDQVKAVQDYEVGFAGYFYDLRKRGAQHKLASTALNDLADKVVQFHRNVGTKQKSTVLIPRYYIYPETLSKLTFEPVNKLLYEPVLPVSFTLKAEGTTKHFLRFSDKEDVLPLLLDKDSEDYQNLCEALYREAEKMDNKYNRARETKHE